MMNSTQQIKRKRLRQTNTKLQQHLNEAVHGHIKDATRYLSKTHTSLCNDTRTMQDVRRDLRLACEELTELSVECMSLKQKTFTTHPKTANQLRGDWSRWETLAGVSSKTDNRFQTLLSSSTKPDAQILKDIPRTPSFGHEKTVDTQQLINVLHAYQMHDPQCSYVQGMNTIASFLLSRTEDEERAFWLLVQILGSPKYNLRGFYQTDMPQLHIACYQFDQLLDQRLNRISKHFITLRINSKDFLSSWYLSLFTAVQNINYTLLTNIFEYYVEVGYTALLSIALGILAVYEQKLLTMNHEAVLSFLKLDLWKTKGNERKEDGGGGGGGGGSEGAIDLNRVIAAASKPNVLNQRDLDRMEVEWKNKERLNSTR
jgi:hypothetical protein